MEELKILQKDLRYDELCLSCIGTISKGREIRPCCGYKEVHGCYVGEDYRGQQKKYYKKTTLQELDVEVEKLKAYVRLSYNLGFYLRKKYEQWSGLVVEIGRMVGGWIKSVSK